MQNPVGAAWAEAGARGPTGDGQPETAGGGRTLAGISEERGTVHRKCVNARRRKTQLGIVLPGTQSNAVLWGWVSPSPTEEAWRHLAVHRQFRECSRK